MTKPHNELLRIVRLSPYRRGCGPSLSIRLYDTNRVDYSHGAKCILHVDAVCLGRRYSFEFCASPMHSVDADETVLAAIHWAMWPGDDEIPEGMTAEWQQHVIGAHGEQFELEAENRFGSERAA